MDCLHKAYRPKQLGQYVHDAVSGDADGDEGAMVDNVVDMAVDFKELSQKSEF